MEKEKKKGSGLFFKLIVLILIAVLLFSGYKIVTILLEYHAGTSAYEEVQKVAKTGEDDSRGIDFDALKKKNKDIRAWLYAEDTPLNYPVVQGEDNEYYLYRMFNGEWNGKGTLFIDFRCKKPFKGFNTIIYGHRMKDGSMFHFLTKYEKLSYFQEHPVLELTTPEAAYDAEIFAAVRIPADSPLYRMEFEGRQDRKNYLETVQNQSLIDTGVSVTADDTIIMLSTCTYEFEDARMVVYAKLTKKTAKQE